VSIAGWEDGIVPHSRSLNDPKELEEERRLAYVAITRAEETLYLTHSMRRRAYGEYLASEPSQFLNELPLELIDDLSHGNSWLSYKQSSRSSDSSYAVSALRGENEPKKTRAVYTGKTYNSTEAINEFFNSRGMSKPAEPKREPRPTGFEKLRAASSGKPASAAKSSAAGGILPGSHVRHAKYGKGLVLRREGSGDNVKLTISFPGFGQKKLIEKFANLQNED